MRGGAADMKLSIIAPMLHDVDEPHDLDRLPPHWSGYVAA